MSSPLVRLASLDLVRGFVAVGRRMSITLAAEDLCLTQSAVSRQVHALEEAVGRKLFLRGYRAIAFTPDGERLFRIADVAVQQLQDVFGSFSSARDRVPVTVTASIGVTALWLLPRLGRFQQQHPAIDVRVAANNKLLDLRGEGVDLAIRYCPASAAPDGAIRLFGESVVPVAHPSLQIGRLDSPASIARHVLLEYDDARRPWLQWSERLSSSGLGGAKPKGVLRFNQYDQVIQAAVAGQGIALGRLALIEPMLADGRLVALASVAQEVATQHAYWLIQVNADVRRDVADVVNWIRNEAMEPEAALSVGADARAAASSAASLTTSRRR